MTVEFNPTISIDDCRAAYQHDQRMRITNVFTPELARQITQYLQSSVTFHNAYTVKGVPNTIDIDSLRAMSPKQQQLFIHQIYTDASQGVGFFYGRNKVTDTQGSALTSQLLAFLNSEDTLEKVRRITGMQDIQSASAQVTRYTPGHFLTRHNDLHETEHRRVAYVLNFTESWHPDWGGLLQFFEQDGTPKDAWAPQFNSMVLFDVKHVHSVTYVAPFAPKPRLSVTGWFRATPLEA